MKVRELIDLLELEDPNDEVSVQALALIAEGDIVSINDVESSVLGGEVVLLIE